MSVGMDKYLNDILSKIYTNQDLCKYLYYDQTNPLSQATIADTSVLLTDKTNQRIFIKPFVVETVDKTKSTLHIIPNNFELDYKTNYYNDFEIDFIIAINVRIWQLDNDGDGDVVTRLSAIVNELFLTFNRQQSVGLGKHHFNMGKIQKFNDYFWGMIVSFKLMECPTYTV